MSRGASEEPAWGGAVTGPGPTATSGRPMPTSPTPTRTSPGVPHATFLRLRHDDPVSWWGEDHAGGRGFWAVTRHADLLRVSRDVGTFSSAQGIRLEEMDAEETEARRTMMELDPPEHTAYRRLVSKPFSRREVYAYEQAIRTLARAVIDDALAGGPPFDFVDAIAKQLPMRMLGTLLGVPDDDGPWLVEQRRRAARQHRPRVHDAPRRPRRHRRVPADAVPQPGRDRAVPIRPGSGPAPARAPDRRRDQRSAGAEGRRRGAQRARVQQLLHAARRRRQRHHALHDDGRA